MTLSQALFIRKGWVNKILDEGKTWEIRGCVTMKRERFYLAESKANQLRGEATLVDCKLVAVKCSLSQAWVPPPSMKGDQLDLIMNKRNYKKLGFNPATHMPDFLQKYDKLYAWIMDKVVKCEVPLSWQPTPGPVIW